MLRREKTDHICPFYNYLIQEAFLLGTEENLVDLRYIIEKSE